MHRPSLVNLLVIGGDEADRLQIATTFHLESRLHRGPLVAARAPEDSPRIIAAILRSLKGAVPLSRDLLHASEGGTLFLDRIERLAKEEQRLLLEFLSRGRSEPSTQLGWAGRLAVGASTDLELLCEDGRFLASLYDALDKIRIDLRVPS
jgi:DNA-binding NtrC family response regulator